MRTNSVKAKLRRGEPSLGAWLSLPSVSAARIMARIGFDWLVVDMEHSAQDAALMADMVGAIADAGTCAPIVRVPSNSVEWFKWALDAGAWGVVVPMVNSHEEAHRAVEYCKYPPLGSRSIGGTFAPYGFGVSDWHTYAAAANDEIIVTIQIESIPAMRHLEEIFEVPGIDVAFVGPNDLHAQLGLTPSSDGAEPAFMGALESIREQARKRNIALGIFAGNGESAAMRLRQGFQMVSVTTDVDCMVSAAVENLRLANSTS
jgi:4-hydroxy-2-oxoheptanedioate aldolase